MKQTIQVIQGDTLDLKVSVLPTDYIDLIGHVYFSCKELGIHQELTKTVRDGETYWLFRIEDTANLPVCYTSYDITVVLQDDSVQTSLYNGDFYVLRKRNTINE